MKALRFIFANLGPFRSRFLALLGAGVVDAIASFSIPLLLAEFTKRNFTVESWQEIVPLLVICTVTSIGMQWLMRCYGEALGRLFTNHLQLRYFAVVEGQEVATLQKHHSGYVLSLISRVTGSAGGLSVGLLWLIPHLGVLLTLFFIVTAQENIGVALLNVVLLTAFLSVSLWFSSRMVPMLSQLNLSGARASQRFVDVMGNILTVKRLRIKLFAHRYLKDATDEVDQGICAIQRFHAVRWAVLHTIFAFAFIGTISFLLWRISQGRTNAAVLVLFISAFATLRGYVERLSEMVKDLMELGGYVTTLEQLLSPLPPLTLPTQARQWDVIQMRDLSFQYPDNGASISVPGLVLRRGDIVCITGESGQGKSTLLALVAGLINPTGGAISLDGVPYSQLDGSIEGLFAITSQEVDLFAMNIRDNLRLGRPITDERIIETLDLVGLSPWLRGLPRGLETEIGERGVRLSAGQRQRLNLARALLLDREVLLLDEPTSHLDRTTERRVVDALRAALVGKTAIIVTHREATLALATVRYRFNQGVLVRCG